MAGEWIPIDCNLGTKPEVMEIVVLTGQPVEVVGWRLIQLWSWAAMNTADGVLRTTPATIGMVCGGDESFWQAVAEVGWLTFDGKTCTIAGWDKRFSKAAKARVNAAKRQDSFRKSRQSNAAPLRQRDDSVVVRNAGPSPEERRGEERREELKPAAPVVATSDPPKRRNRSQPKDAIEWLFDFGWVGIKPADREAWATAYPACTLDIELVRATEWLKANPTKARKSNWRRFLVSWLTRSQDRGGTNRSAGKTPEDVAKKARLEQKAQEFSRYQPASYRTPKEAMRIAEASRIQDEVPK